MGAQIAAFAVRLSASCTDRTLYDSEFSPARGTQPGAPFMAAGADRRKNDILDGRDRPPQWSDQ
jgi:hypothetical protein